EEVLLKLDRLGMTPMPLAEGSPYLMLNLSSVRSISDEQLTALEAVKDQLIWLNLAYSGISDGQLPIISKLTNLRALYLNYTGISDTGLSALSALLELRLLNLVGTGITDGSVDVLVGFEKLTNLYLY